MNIKPILFNTDMVRAILEDRKTVTRRVVKPQPKEQLIPTPASGCWPGYFAEGGTPCVVRPPYFVGDILYVRETWKQATCDPAGGGYALTDLYLYKADEPIDTNWMMVEDKWHPSIHMPKKAARIFLRVTDVRVERLDAFR